MHKKSFAILKRAFPILRWLPKYNLDLAIADAISGVTIGLTLIPQSIAYANLAELEPQYGLYSALCGGIVYAIFGTVAEINIAPTSLLSLMVLSYTQIASFGEVPAAVLLCFLSGIVEVCCGLTHLGFLVDFVSTPVVAGLTSAGAVFIASAQVKSLLGLTFKAEKFLSVWINVVKYIREINWWDTTLGLCCCVLLLALRKLKDYGTPPLEGNKEKIPNVKFHIVRKVLWFVSVGRNALIVLISTIMAYILHSKGQTHISIVEEVPSGLPNISFPAFEVMANNHTYTFVEMVMEMGSGIAVIPFIAILANIAVAKAFAKGKVLDASQEMLAVGMCNIVGSFVSSIPVNASFSRAAVSNASGARTTFSGIYTGIMVILSLTFLTPYFAYIPKATLAAVIICAVIFMVEVTISKSIWKINRIDMCPLISTFIACLALGIEIGILIGIAVDMILVMYYTARPKIDVQRVIIEGNEYMKITPTSSIFYPSAEFLRQNILRTSIQNEKNCKGIIMDCSKISKTDFTTVKCMGALTDDLNKTGKTIAFAKIDPAVSKVLTRSCHSCIIAFTDEALAQMLKERRNSEILNNYKNISVTNGDISVIFENCDLTKM